REHACTAAAHQRRSWPRCGGRRQCNPELLHRHATDDGLVSVRFLTGGDRVAVAERPLDVRFPLRVGYHTLAQLARAAARVAPTGGGSKFLRALNARRGIRQRYRAWGETHRDPSRPLLWMHAPSVGEGLQARPVLELMRRRHPNVQLAYTHFSPSAAAFSAGLDVDFRDYLMFDTPGDAAAALDALRPTALVFSKLDVWPTLVRLADERDVRLGIISATMASGSSRRSGM